jgi:hypothetical protein
VSVIGEKARGKDTLERQRQRVFDWIGLAQDTDKWRYLMNEVMDFRLHKCWDILEWLYKCLALEYCSAPYS